MDLTYNYTDNNTIPNCNNFLINTNNSNYGRENAFNSINNNLSTSLSSFDKNNEKKK